jgi:soluble lytic murein transglycosylase-like protein
MALGGLTTGHAAERVTLRNGFELRCDHHAEIAGRMRLYQTHDEQSYIEFAPNEISLFEPVAEEVAKKAAPVVANSAEGSAGKVAAPEHIVPKPMKDVRLSDADLHQMLVKAGDAHDLDADLLASIVKAESGGHTRAVSRTGARGLMQLMPGTANELGVADSFKPEENVRGGSAYLDALLRYYRNNLALALAAYNAGPAAVDKYHGIPPYRETRAYVARVIHEFNRRVLAREALAKSVAAAEPIAGGTR